ncbi:hypothetical protein SEA_GODONK_167 [Gordonia phage GodonK]|uniref:Lipoprotein n=1 Tax=Gordonia phage GodonK TaxID=2562192 RepID=A0A4D6E470_9CAUD|nr:hypothetical protein HOV33_gp201 [Gordonia phage GodonK]QBZ72755.1 hypothetical protein SEA_GODONK_167 [Gordonia phage GodonK]
MKVKAAVIGAAAAIVLLLSGCGDTLYSGEVIEKDKWKMYGKTMLENNLKLRDCIVRNDDGECRTDWIRVDDRTFDSTEVGDWHQHTS